MTEPFITITVSIYNNIEGLEKTIPSVLKQDYKNAEVIISDDGSSKYDTSMLYEYAEQLRQKYDKVRVNINEKNVGTVKHLNKIYAMAEGKYFFDISPGDVFLESDSISKTVAYFEKTGALIVSTRRQDEYEDGHVKVRPGKWVGLALRFAPKQLRNYMVNKKNVLSGCGTYYSKALFEKYGPFDEQYVLVEDYPYYVMLLDKGQRIHWFNKVTISHEMGGVSNGDVHPLVWKDIERLHENLKNP